MEELFAIADKVTVIRDGTYVGTRTMKETSYKELVQLMVGRELNEIYTKPAVTPGKKVLEVRNLSSGTRVKQVSFSLYKGEILGFYGLVGSGRSELMRTIFGIDPLTGGEIHVGGQKSGDPKSEGRYSIWHWFCPGKPERTRGHPHSKRVLQYQP